MNDHRGRVLRLQPNRVWRTYSGGRILDEMEGRENPADGPFPEDWLGSTVRAINPESKTHNEGLARVLAGGQEALLADLVESDPIYFLGQEHLDSFGSSPMVLVKYLDSAVRLPFQVHPTVEFSRRHLGTESGKTEAYYILSTRPEVNEPFIYLGFQRPPTREELRRMILEQDLAAMERCFDRIPVRPGDIYLVPGGLPHAIGGGVSMVEVMEPTDFVARVEFNVAGRTIPESARFMGRDVEFALDMFSHQAWSIASVQSQWRCIPQIIEQNSTMTRESLVDERKTDRFRVTRTALSGSHTWQSSAFTVMLVVEGACILKAPQDELSLSKYDRVIVPHGMPSLEIIAKDRVVLLESNPPRSGMKIPPAAGSLRGSV